MLIHMTVITFEANNQCPQFELWFESWGLSVNSQMLKRRIESDYAKNCVSTLLQRRGHGEGGDSLLAHEGQKLSY